MWAVQVLHLAQFDLVLFPFTELTYLGIRFFIIIRVTEGFISPPKDRMNLYDCHLIGGQKVDFLCFLV